MGEKMFTVIKGNPKPKVDKGILYLEAVGKQTEKYKKTQSKDDLKKLIFYGVMAISKTIKFKNDDSRFRIMRFDFISLINLYIGKLTPTEFMQMFPIKKDYDGKRWEVKDYFYTMEEINKMVKDEPIGDKVEEFLYDYHNDTIRYYSVEFMSSISDMRILKGEKGIFEEWAEDNGISISTMHKTAKGKEFMIDGKTGKSFKVKKVHPRYLKIVK